MYDDLIASAADTYFVPESWIRAVIQVESSWNPSAFRAEPAINDASYGLMQLLSTTARGLGYSGDPTGLYDPATNIALGAELLGQLRAKYGDDFNRVYSAYNSGKPDAYLTSTQVANDVAKAVAALATYVNQDVSALTSAVASSPQSQSGAAFIVLVIMLLWTGRRK